MKYLDLGQNVKSLWLEHVIDSVADRGRDLLNLRTNGKAAANVEKLCRALLSEKGEASGTALAREVVQTYSGMNEEDRLDFFDMLSFAFGQFVWNIIAPGTLSPETDPATVSVRPELLSPLTAAARPLHANLFDTKYTRVYLF